MPLVRVEVKSEYALGSSELYRQVNEEDPKEILEGLAVSGLVGVLRQLGDLAEFAAEVFHGLQDDVMTTSSRSHKLMARVQHIEAALPPLEKAVLSQRSHLHFAYTAGSNWQAHIQCEQNHFICSDVPQFIMDSYEDCRGCPRLHLLDRFDPGGRGSCLKRYSDPTFFKRASVASGEANTEKNSKDKNRRKIKKRRSEGSKGATFFDHGGRVQFTQLNVGGKSSSQMTCTSEDIVRSDMGEPSKLDLTNGSGYIESDFRSSYSIQPEKLESRESISSPAKRHDSDFLDCNFLGQKVTDVYDGIQINPSRDQADCSSSYVTWDEKTYAVGSAAQEYDASGTTQEDDLERNTVSFSSKLNLENQGVNLETVDKNDVIPCNEALPTLESSDILVEDIDSETDQFMDALNTIESDFEIDANCTKEKEGCYSNLDDIGADGRVCSLKNSNLEHQSLKSESNVVANGSMIDVSFEHDAFLVSPKSPSTASPQDKNLQSALRTGESLNREGMLKVDPLEHGDIDDGAVEGHVSNTVLSNYRDDMRGLTTIDGARNSPESKKPAPKTSNVTSVMFWTNGGLLGLSPSKPPDYSLVNALPQDPSSENDEKNRKTSSTISPADLAIKHGNTRDLIDQSNDSSTVDSSVASRSLLPVDSAFQSSTNHQENSTSSRIFELGNRLFTTGANEKQLHYGNESVSPASYQTARGFGQKNHQKFAYQTFSGPYKDLIGRGSQILSPSSSPPLEHMKISFQPIDGFETSKLKLEFPDRNYNNESSRGIFPSFQLVPEVSGTLQNDGSNSDNSDDDTFYRSSPSLIDGCISRQSESNSDQWESGESSCSKDHDLYDSFCRISLTESVSMVNGAGRKSQGDIPENCKLQSPFVGNGVQNSKSQNSSDLQSLDTQNHSFREECIKNANSQYPSGSQCMISPATPPLPPVQWRGIMPHQNANCEALPEAFKYAFDRNLSGSTISQLPKPAPLNQNHMENTNIPDTESDLHDSNAKEKDTRQKSIDKKEDFLHQIKTRSFSLRPTTTTKPFVQSVGHSNVQVTAILEKANAVRQAVASDDDGNWSDA